jgi:hypothetical protein
VVAELLDQPGLEEYRNADEAFFLKAAGEAIRDFCGWHIAPSDTVTGARIPVGQRGIIMLPSLHVTAVTAVTVDDRVLVYPDEYEWESAGFITCRWGTVAVVDYERGHPELPATVEAIGYELAQRAIDTVSVNTRQFGAGPNTISLAALGIELTDNQQRRLLEGGYAMPGVR